MPTERIWIARAAYGLRATVLTLGDSPEKYREMGWQVEGPYVLEQPSQSKEAEPAESPRRNHAPWCSIAHEGPCLPPQPDEQP